MFLSGTISATYAPRLQSGMKSISFSGSELTIFTADDDVTQTSQTVFRSDVVFMYATTVQPGKRCFAASMSSLSICSAMGQPADGSAKITVFSGDSSLTVSAIKRTPHIITFLCGTFVALTLSANESPVKSAISVISCA